MYAIVKFGENFDRISNNIFGYENSNLPFKSNKTEIVFLIHTNV